MTTLVIPAIQWL